MFTKLSYHLGSHQQSLFLILAVLMGGYYCSISCGSNSISLMINDVDYLSTCLLTTYRYYFLKCLFSLFVHLKNQVTVLLSCKNFLCILHNNNNNNIYFSLFIKKVNEYQVLFKLNYEKTIIPYIQKYFFLKEV